MTALTPPIIVGSGTVTINSADSVTATSGLLADFTATTGGTLINDGSMTLTSTGSTATTGVLPDQGFDSAKVFENNNLFSVSGFQATGVAGEIATNNSGTFTVTGTGLNATTGATGDATNSGSMTIQGASTTTGVDDQNGNGIVKNLAGGTLSATSTSGAAIAINVVSGNDAENAGVIMASGVSAIGIGYSAQLVDIVGGHTPPANTINNSGAITVTGGSATGMSVSDTNRAGVGGTITNSGTISATSVGINFSSLFSGGGYSIQNSGTISAQTAISTVGFANPNVTNTGVINGAIVGAGFLTNSNTITGAVSAYGVANSGTITGAVTASAGSITNSGTINGAVTASAGLDSHAGTINGAITFDSGSTLTLGAENNTVLVIGTGANVLDGGGGTNTLSYAGLGVGVSVSLALPGQAQTQTTGEGTQTVSNFQNLTGTAQDDHLIGNAQNNIIDGGGGNDTLTGGGGADTFVYRSGYGNFTITDFSASQGDKIDLSTIEAIHDLQTVLAASSQVGADTVIQIGGGSVILQNVQMSALVAADFNFAPGPTVGPGIGGTPQVAPAGGGVLTGGSGDDWLQGQGGNDTLHGGPGSDYLDGGAGLNTATYDGVYRQYAVATGAPGAATVTGGPEGGSDTLVNIQRIQFVDGYLATGITDTAAEVYRLYEATLGRAPDPEGLANWVHALNGGATLQSVANGFVGSAEFQQTYGSSLSNTAFVTLLYDNVLHRDPDAGGLSNWVNMLNAGTESRSQVVTGFSESSEDITDLAAPVQAGLWIQDAAAAEVARLYDAALGRLPDVSGLSDWTHMLESGADTLLQATQGFIASAEFQANYGSLGNTAFVTLLYENTLHRAPDPGGLIYWTGELNSADMSRAQVVLGFSDSAEHIADTAPHIDGGIWVAS